MTASEVLEWAYREADGNPDHAAALLAWRYERDMCHSFFRTGFFSGGVVKHTERPAVDDGDAWVDTGKDDTSKAVAG